MLPQTTFQLRNPIRLLGYNTPQRNQLGQQIHKGHTLGQLGIRHPKIISDTPPGTDTGSPQLNSYDASGPENYQDIYRTPFEKSGMCMASLDPAFRVLEANTDFFHRFGRSPDHVRGPSIQLISAKNLLTPIDAKVLEGVAAGISTIQLATLLFLSRGGVEYHVATLMRKFKVTNRPALVSKCYSTGVFVLGSWPPRVLPEYTK